MSIRVSKEKGKIIYDCESVEDAIKLGIVISDGSPVEEPVQQPIQDVQTPVATPPHLPLGKRKYIKRDKRFSHVKEEGVDSYNIKKGLIELDLKKIAESIPDATPESISSRLEEFSYQKIKRYMDAVDYFMRFNVNIKYAIHKIVFNGKLHGNTGGVSYKCFKVCLYKMYPKYADKMIARRHHMKSVKGRQRLDKESPLYKKNKYKSRHEPVSIKPHQPVQTKIESMPKRNTEPMRAWMGFLHEKLTQRGATIRDKDAVAQISAEWKQRKSSASPSVPVLDAEPASQPKVFPLIFPMIPEFSNALIEQIKQMLKTGTALQLENVSTFTTVFGSHFNPRSFEKFCEVFITKASEVASYFDIADKFYINRENNHIEIKYKGKQ